MFVPLHDENTLKSIRFQYVTLAIIAINIVIYLLEATRLDDVAIASFAIIPNELFDTSLFPLPTDAVGPAYPERLTLLTFMFFLIKGLAWLIVPAVLIWWRAMGG